MLVILSFVILVIVFAMILSNKDKKKYGMFNYEDPKWKEGRENSGSKKTPRQKTE